MKRAPRRGWISTIVGIILLGLMLFPVYWMVNASLQPAGDLVKGGWFPFHPDFSGYTVALHDQGHNLVTRLIVALGSTALSLGLAAPAAYALAHLRLRGGNLLLFGTLLTQMVPGIVVANALYGAYNQLELLNTYTGLILADSTAGVPFAIIIMRSFMARIAGELIEAARLDGAGRLRIFRSVVLPVSRNALIAAGVLTFLFAWSDFLFALTLTTTDAVRPVTLGIYQYIGAHSRDWNAVMATAVLSSAPAALLLIAAQRHVTEGTVGGAVK